jgi:hypothetical protein
MQTSVAMEAYGYLTALRRGDTPRAANDLPYNQRLSEAVEALPVELGELVRDDVSVWVQKAADAYNGTKHANRPLPDGIESWLIANTLILVLRLLILRLVGANDEELVKSKDRMGWYSLKDVYQRRG